MELRRDLRGLRRLVRGRAREARAWEVPPGLREHGADLRPGRREPALHLPLFLGAYPITPASDVLEQLAQLKQFGVRTFQAEDEIAASGLRSGLPSEARSGSRPRPARASSSSPRRWGWQSRSSSRSSSWTSSGPARRRACRRSRSRPICCWSCSGGTQSRRCPSSPPRRLPDASTLRSRLRESRSSTARPCSCSRTPTWQTARSRG